MLLLSSAPASDISPLPQATAPYVITSTSPSGSYIVTAPNTSASSLYTIRFSGELILLACVAAPPCLPIMLHGGPWEAKVLSQSLAARDESLPLLFHTLLEENLNSKAMVPNVWHHWIRALLAQDSDMSSWKVGWGLIYMTGSMFFSGSFFLLRTSFLRRCSFLKSYSLPHTNRFLEALSAQSLTEISRCIWIPRENIA